MQLVNIHEAKTRLSKLLEQVQSGEEIAHSHNRCIWRAFN